MELYQLACFVEVARQRNFTRAAERLHLAQPALSQQIQKLEAKLGAELFVRGRRRGVLSARLPCWRWRTRRSRRSRK